VLNIQSGRFERVFGGNNLGGQINGTIEVNIEETGCHPIIIGQLYGGGNQAAYTAPSGSPGPTINVKSFTSIGEIYGGGYGASATVTGSTNVNIDECEGLRASDEVENTAAYTGKNVDIEVGEDDEGNAITETVYQPEHESGKIGVIGTVFGGGNAAKVDGDTNVNIGTKSSVTYVTGDKANHVVKGVNIIGNVYGGGNKAEVTGSTNVRIGKDEATGNP